MGPRVIPAILALVACLPIHDRVATPTDAPSWSRTCATPPKSLGLAGPDRIVIQTDADVQMLDSTTGRMLWSRPDIVQLRPIGDRPYGLATTRDGQRVIDLETGLDRWPFEQLAFTAVKGVLPLPARAQVLVYGTTADSPHTLVAVRDEDGAVVWRQTDLFRRLPPDTARKIVYTDRQPVLVGPDLLLLDPTHDGLLGLAPADGRLLWRVDERTAKQPASYREGAAVSVVAADRLFVPVEKALMALSVVDGTRLWTRKSFPTRVAQMAMTPVGLLVRGDFEVRQDRVRWRPYLTLLDPASGTTRWSTEDWSGSFEGRSPFVVDGDQVVVGSKHGLQALNLATGQPSASVAIHQFAGGEFPSRIEEVGPDRFLLTSSQNARVVDLTGRVVYDRYFEAPGESLAAKIAYGALIAGTAATRFMGAPDEPLFRTFKASENHGSYLYTVTGAPDASGRRGTSLLRLDKNTGRESGRIWFGERFPTFVLDPSTQMVVMVDHQTLRAFHFDGRPSR
jgi:outer membrane protein assembly factor BamB